MRRGETGEKGIQGLVSRGAKAAGKQGIQCQQGSVGGALRVLWV
jgi:hypothetical protein